MGVSHTDRMRVRYHECDPQGVVFNAHYVAYFDIAITELWRAAIGTYEAMNGAGVDLVVAEVTANFRAPARADDLIDLTVEVDSLGRTSMITRHVVRRGEEVLVEGRMVHVCVEIPGYTKRAIPDVLREALQGKRKLEPGDWAGAQRAAAADLPLAGAADQPPVESSSPGAAR
jgi:acyl-CoA thioester hydrolase